MSEANPYRALLAAILQRAVNDLRAGNKAQRKSAEAFIRSRAAERYFELLGIPVERARSRLLGGEG